jgi:hypothetical protein
VNIDLLLRRVQTTAILVCVVMAAAAPVVARQRPWASAIAVLAGGVLAGLSYRMIVASAEAIVQILVPAAATVSAPARPSFALSVLKLTGRYALLALLAYVMIARLRLPPLGLLAGASSVVAAVSIEAVRLLAKKTS